MSTMGRPREHDGATREALLDAAERLLAAGGAATVSARAVADEAGTTTRAVYSVFGSMDGLLAALAQRTFEILGRDVRALPEFDDPRDAVVAAGVQVFRPLAVEHPSLYRITFQRVFPALELGSDYEAALADAFEGLMALFARLREAGLLVDRSVREAAIEFHALCEGLASVELRGSTFEPDPERVWRRAFETLVRGYGVSEEPAALPADRPGRRTSPRSASPPAASRSGIRGGR